MPTRSHRLMIVGALALGLLVAAASTASAKGGTLPAPTPATCAKVVVTNSGQTVRDFKMPEIKYNLENCGTDAVAVRVVVSETASAWYPVCASPVAAPAEFALAAKQKLSSSFATYRGPCGYADNRSTTLIYSVYAWQGHNLLLTPVNAATGEVLGDSSWFSWQDCLLCGGV